METPVVIETLEITLSVVNSEILDTPDSKRKDQLKGVSTHLRAAMSLLGMLQKV